MNIELSFLQKAIKEKNYISFMYKDKSYKKEKALKLDKKDGINILTTTSANFDFALVYKFQVLKDRF